MVFIGILLLIAEVATIVIPPILGFGEQGFMRLFSAEGWNAFVSCLGFGKSADQWIVTLGLIIIGGSGLILFFANIGRYKRKPNAIIALILGIVGTLSLYVYGAAPNPYFYGYALVNYVAIALSLANVFFVSELLVEN